MRAPRSGGVHAAGAATSAWTPTLLGFRSEIQDNSYLEIPNFSAKPPFGRREERAAAVRQVEAARPEQFAAQEMAGEPESVGDGGQVRRPP